MNMVEDFYLRNFDEMDVGNVWFQKDRAGTLGGNWDECFAGLLPWAPDLFEG